MEVIGTTISTSALETLHMNKYGVLKPTRLVYTKTPEPLVENISAPAPYPVDSLPTIMRDAVIAIADYVQAPLALAGQSVLGAAAYIAQTRVDAWSPVRNQMPCSLFMLALGDSGDRKSSVHKIAFNPIEKAEDKRREIYELASKSIREGAEGLAPKELAAYEKSNPMPDDPTTIVTSDCSYSRLASILIEGTPSLFWNSDEGAQMLGGHSMKSDDRTAVLGGLSKWWDDGRGERIRAKNNADGSGTATNRRLSINLLAQEVAIRHELKDPVLRGQGFLPRFLFCAPESLKGTRLLTLERLERKPEDDQRIVTYWNRLMLLLDTPQALNPDDPTQVKAEALSLTNDAKHLWLKFYDKTEIAQKRFGDYADLAPFASRSGEIALRVATVLAHFSLSKTVDSEIMRSAIALTDHSLSEWRRYACTAQVDQDTELAILAIDWLVSKVEAGNKQWMCFDGRQWSQKGYSSLRSAKKRNQAFTVLLEKKHLHTDGTHYYLNPLLIKGAATTATLATI